VIPSGENAGQRYPDTEKQGKEMDPEILLKTALSAAEAAHDIHRSYTEKGFSSESKEKHHDMVTSADLDSERAITSIIYNKFPDHNVIAEEGSYPATGSPYTWFIDPLDGTNNFFKGLPHYSVSIAAAYENETVAGVVKNTARGDLFCAVRGKGATLNGRSLRVNPQENFTNAMLFTGFHYDRGEYMKKTLAAIEHFFQKGIIGIRRSGSAALDICSIAAGWGDGFWEHYLSPWDYAAGELILSEAGGIMTDFSGNPLAMKKRKIIGANRELHTLLVREISEIYG
jgi:myo-inositol-1(or 4)-monophosphatase